MTNCPPCEAVKDRFPPSIARYVNTYIGYQGGCRGSTREIRAPGGRRRFEAVAEPIGRPANRLSHKAMLRELVDRCIAGDCDHATAAKLVGVRRATFSEYIRTEKIRRKALRQLEGAFHAAFPECNPRLYRGHSARTISTFDRPRNDDELFREAAESPCVTYTAEEAEKLPPSQPRLLMPDVEIDFISYNTNREVEKFMAATGRHKLDEPEPPYPELD